MNVKWREGKEEEKEGEEERGGYAYQHLSRLSGLRNGNERNTHWPHYIHTH